MNEAKQQNLSSKRSRTLFVLVPLASIGVPARSGYIINFPRELIIWGVFLSVRRTLYLVLALFSTFIYSDIKHILTRPCHTQHQPHFRYLDWEDKHIIFIEKGLMLWFSNTNWHSEDNERPGPFGHCLAGGKRSADFSCVIESVVGHYKSEWRVAKNSSEIYRICLEMRQAFSQFIMALTMLGSKQREP